MKRKSFALLIALIFLTGCGRVSENTLKEIFEKDPSFEKELNAKKRIDAKISDLKDSYQKEKHSTTQKIHALKMDLRSKKNELNTKILSLEQEIEPNIRDLGAKLEGKRSEYRLAKNSLEDSLAKLKNIRKLLEKKKELTLSADEVSIWNNRVINLEKETASLHKALEALRTQIRLLKTEIRILEE